MNDSECNFAVLKNDTCDEKTAENSEKSSRVLLKSDTRWLNILLIALCAIMAVGLAFYAYQAYQWKNVALEAISLNQKFVETNNELLDMIEGKNG